MHKSANKLGTNRHVTHAQIKFLALCVLRFRGLDLYTSTKENMSYPYIYTYICIYIYAYVYVCRHVNPYTIYSFRNVTLFC